MKHLLDVRTFIFGLILAVLGVGYSIANVVVIPLGGDSANARKFYLTLDSIPDATTATTACASGFHMASMYELLDPTYLRYDHSRGYGWPAGDQGEGPPSGINGWIRTGYFKSSSSIGGRGNCNSWTSTSGSGTYAWIDDVWDGSNIAETAPWRGNDNFCTNAVRVWCVQDY